MQELANTAREFATAVESSAPLLAAFGRALGRRVGRFSVEELGSAVWAFPIADVECAAIRGIGEGIGAARGATERAGPRQHCVCVRSGGSVECAVVCGVGEAIGAARGTLQLTGVG